MARAHGDEALDLSVDGENLDLDIKQLSLPAGKLQGVHFQECRFVSCDFQEARFLHCSFEECRFQQCNLGLLDVEACTFVEVSIEGSKAGGIDWTRARWPDLRLLSGLRFAASDLSYSTFLGMHIPKIEMVDCKAIGADFRDTCLKGADLAGTDFGEALFANADLRQANFVGAKNYQIDPRENQVADAVFELPEALSLLYCLGVKIN